jgi:hypothetical protein
MKRAHTSWSNFTDSVEGPCVVCGQTVRFVIPADRQDPALLYHATCDPTPILRKRLKDIHPPLLSSEFTVGKPKDAADTKDAAAPKATEKPPEA